jgi:hypothetical protein
VCDRPTAVPLGPAGRCLCIFLRRPEPIAHPTVRPCRHGPHRGSPAGFEGSAVDAESAALVGPELVAFGDQRVEVVARPEQQAAERVGLAGGDP